MTVCRQLWPALLPLLLACSAGSRETAPVLTKLELPGDRCAAVGPEQISVETVARIARAQAVAPEQARALAVRDALFAVEAERRLPGVAALRSTVLARSLLLQLKQQAEAGGPPSDDETARLTAERWSEVDRPPSARTAHAVVLTKSAEDDARARDVAERLKRAVAGISDPEQFVAAAQRTDAGNLELRAERLPFMTVDGRAVPGPDGAAANTTFDVDFARAANALERAGEQSPPVRTRFGYHVILLEEKLPERRLPLDERRRLFEPEIRVRRARTLERALLERLRGETIVELSRAAAEMMAQVRVSE